MNDRLDTTEEASPSKPEHTEAAPLVDLLLSQRGLPEDLSGQTVPEYLMQLPISLSVQWLYHHGRQCRIRNCPHTPGPLRPLLKFHNEVAVAEQNETIHRALWSHPESPMVEFVRSRVVEVEDHLARALNERAATEALHEYVDADGVGVPRFAALLWARGLEDPGERQLFRLLPLLGRPAEPGGAIEEQSSKEGESEKDRSKRKRKAAEDRAEELAAEVRELTSKSRERKKRIDTLERDLERAKERESTAQRRSDELQEYLQISEEKTQIAKREARETSKAARDSNRIADDLRDAFQRAEDQLEQSEAEQSALRRQLALVQNELEQTQTALRSIPRGKDAVATFLSTEEEEIDQDLNIKQGADRQRAEARHALHRKLALAFREAYPEFKSPRPAHTLGLRSVHFQALGGGAEVGRSSYLLEIGSARVLVDCGIAVGRDSAEAMPDIDGLGTLDAVVLTHSHTDHLGWLPVLIKNQPQTVPIYCSEETSAIAPIMLGDAHDNYRRRLAEERLIASLDPDAADVNEAYTDHHRKDVEVRLRPLRWDESRDIAGGLKLRLFPAGHILGAASVVVEGGGRRVVVSGDISSENQKTVQPSRPPSDLGEVDFLVLESTYGDRDTGAGQPARDELVDFVCRATKDGTALLPCFALGRGQEVLKILLDAKHDGKIDGSVTILVDGLIRKILPTYVERGRIPEHGYQMIATSRERAMTIADCQRTDYHAVVVTTSGMLNGGPIVEWARALLPSSHHRMALLGYQDGESVGGRLRRLMDQQGRPPYRLPLPGEDGESTEVQIANPVGEIGLSAHADRRGLIEYASMIEPDAIALVHGETVAQEHLRAKLEDRLPTAAVSCPGDQRIQVL